MPIYIWLIYIYIFIIYLVYSKARNRLTAWSLFKMHTATTFEPRMRSIAVYFLKSEWYIIRWLRKQYGWILRPYFYEPQASENTDAHSCNIQPHCLLFSFLLQHIINSYMLRQSFVLQDTSMVCLILYQKATVLFTKFCTSIKWHEHFSYRT